MNIDNLIESQRETNLKKDWIPYNVHTDSSFFPIFLKVIKQVESNQQTVTISTINKERSQSLHKEVKDIFRFIFDWQDENICGILVFKRTEDI
jgi:hypothetical protein